MAFLTRAFVISPFEARLLTRAALLEPELRQAILVMSRVGEGALRKKLRMVVVRPRMRATRRIARVRSFGNVVMNCIDDLESEPKLRTVL